MLRTPFNHRKNYSVSCYRESRVLSRHYAASPNQKPPSGGKSSFEDTMKKTAGRISFSSLSTKLESTLRRVPLDRIRSETVKATLKLRDTIQRVPLNRIRREISTGTVRATLKLRDTIQKVPLDRIRAEIETGTGKLRDTIQRVPIDKIRSGIETGTVSVRDTLRKVKLEKIRAGTVNAALRLMREMPIDQTLRQVRKFQVKPLETLTLAQQQLQRVVALSLERIPSGTHHWVDSQIGPLTYARSKHRFYERGWGTPESIDFFYRMKAQPQVFLSECQARAETSPIKIVRENVRDDHITIDATFRSPLHPYLPEEAKQCHFRLYLPRTVNVPKTASMSPYASIPPSVPVCFFYAATGDHGYVLRKALFSSYLLKQGIASVLIENPFYGVRKPKEQWENCLLHLSDLFLAGGGLIGETQAIVKWLQSSFNIGLVGVSGISMGGIMSGLVAVHSPMPVAIIPIIAPHSAAPVFTSGVLSGLVDWKVLDEEVKTRAPGLSAKQYMDKLLTDLTDLRSYPPPAYPQYCIQVSARHDRYVPAGDILQAYWPGSELRTISAGHLTSVVLNWGDMRRAVIDAFGKLQVGVSRMPPAAAPAEGAGKLLQ